MAEQIQAQIPVRRITSGASPRAGAEALTFKEVITMMRQHIWLVIFFPIAGFIIGVLSWYLLLTYFPRYTANSYVEVLSPVERDPLKIGENVIDRERQYNYRMSLAMLITEQGMLGRLLEVRRDIITPTEWFKSFGTRPERKAEAADKALKDLKKHLRASVDRDSEIFIFPVTQGWAVFLE